MTARITLRCALSAALFTVFASAAVAQEDRLRVAVAPFEIPSGIAKDVGPQMLLDLTVEAGNRSKQYKPTLPGVHLAKVLDQYRAQLGLGIVPEDLKLDREKTQADILLLPTLAKTTKGWLATTSIVDLKTLERVAVYKAETDDPDGWRTLPGDLWRQFALLRPQWTASLGKGIAAHRIVVDSGRVFAQTKRGVAVYSAADGKRLWEESREGNLSLLVAGDTTYQSTGGGHVLVARSSGTGEEKWQLKLEHPAYPGGAADGKVWLVGQDLLSVVDSEQGRLLWSQAASRSSDATATKQKLFVLDGKVGRCYNLVTGAKEEEHRYEEAMLKDLGVRGFNTSIRKNFGTTWFSMATAVSATDKTLSVTDMFVRFGPLGQEAQVLRLENDLQQNARSSGPDSLSLDRGQAFVLVTSPRLREGIVKTPGTPLGGKPEDTIGFDHRLYCCRTTGAPMRVIWQQKFDSPGARSNDHERVVVCHSANHVFVVAGGDLRVFDRDSGKPQATLDMGGKLVHASVADGWLYLATSGGEIRALSIDKP